MRQQVDANPDDQFWRALGLVLKQFDGLVDGYRARVSSEGPAASHVYGNLTKRDLLFMNGNGELYDVLAKPRNITEPGNTADGLLRFNPHSAASFDDPSLSPGALFTRLAGSGKCSALIKVASDLSNLYMAHSTWDTFTAMLRIFKHYHLNLNDEYALGLVLYCRMAFSGDGLVAVKQTVLDYFSVVCMYLAAMVLAWCQSHHSHVDQDGRCKAHCVFVLPWCVGASSVRWCFKYSRLIQLP